MPVRRLFPFGLPHLSLIPFVVSILQSYPQLAVEVCRLAETI